MLLCLIVFQRIKLMIAIALIHLCFEGWFPLGYVKNIVLLSFFCHNCISKMLIQLNRTTIWKDFSQYTSKYMALKICSLKHFEPCIYFYRRFGFYIKTSSNDPQASNLFMIYTLPYIIWLVSCFWIYLAQFLFYSSYLVWHAVKAVHNACACKEYYTETLIFM